MKDATLAGLRYTREDEIMEKLGSSAIKHDSDKLRMDLIPVSSQRALATILTYGAKKYSDRNWEKGFNWGRPYAALQRHLTAWWDGEDLDAEFGKSHLWHALCELAFLIEFEAKGTGTDDRPKRPQTNSGAD